MLLGARQFFERRGAPTPPLPYDAEVEYIESTGTQWIDTGCGVQDGNMAIRFSLMNTTGDVRYGGYYIYGSWQGTSISGLSGGMVLATINGYFRLGQLTQTSIPADTGTHVLSVTAPSVFLDGASTSASARAPVKDGIYYGSFYLFGQQYNGTFMSGGRMRVYGFACGDKSDLIPVRKDGVGYMYDKVSGTLLGNSGTGAFLYGPDKS